MSIPPYTEAEINQKILNKIKPTQFKKRRGDPKGIVKIDGKKVLTFRYPNPHRGKTMYHEKSKYIAEALKLQHDEFTQLIDCDLSGADYYDILKARI